MSAYEKKALGLCLFLAALAGASILGHASRAVFTSQTANPGNSFSAAASFETLNHFEIDAVGEQTSGAAFSVTVRAKTASGATFADFNGTVQFSVNGGSVSPTTSNSFSNGVVTQNLTISGAYKNNTVITVSGGSPTRTGSSNSFVLHDWKYYFTKGTANTGTNCPGASRKRDMKEGYAGSDPEETIRKDVGEPLILCSDTFTAGQSLGAGAATVNGYIENSSGSSCVVTATLYKNGTSSLGSASLTLAQFSPLALRTWTINHSGTSLAAGDRLVLVMSWGTEKACQGADLHYGGTTNRSYLQLNS